jgi:glycosyltransferase involved in cell wall biosynthesis
MSIQRLSLSILVPVYNEQYLIRSSLLRLIQLAKSEYLSKLEIIIVDDGSGDSTPQVLQDFRREFASSSKDDGVAEIDWIFLRHDRNQGKGAAVRTALARATCDITIIHDADLEYDPKDIPKLLSVFVEHSADAVFGSRFAGSDVRRVLFFRHQLANRILTLLCNLVSDFNLTDVWTCYKAVRTDLFKSIPLLSNDFRLEPEITLRLAKRGARLFEVPISYVGRTYKEGKKIGIKDALLALFAIFRFALSDNIYKEDSSLSQMLSRLGRADRFNRWMADAIRPYCGERVLEIGGGTGNLTMQLIPRFRYVVSDINPLYLQRLQTLGGEDRPYLEAAYCDVTEIESFPKDAGGYDTVICLNVIEHVENDRAALSNIKKVLARDGRAIILVPQGAWNYGSLDKVLGHVRRYSAATLQELASDCGLTISHLVGFNRVGSAVWFLNGRIVRRKAFGFMEMWFLNWLTPIFRLMDKLLPLPPLSLIAVMENQHSDKEYSTDSHAVYDDHSRPNPLNDTYLRPSERFPSAPEHAGK